jgi:hypothetical protein
MSTYVRVAGAWGAVLVLAACAQTSSGVKPQASAAAAAQDPSCLTQTGSRLGDGTTCTATGRSYSKDDLDRTGATTVGGSLRLLDPSLSISH